jgi:hypothetical protein
MKYTQSKDRKANKPSAMWPQDGKKNKGAGTNNSIGKYPSANNKDKGTTKTSNSNTPAGEPEINAPIYDPETTKKKMPVMDKDFKTDG